MVRFKWYVFFIVISGFIVFIYISMIEREVVCMMRLYLVIYIIIVFINWISRCVGNVYVMNFYLFN